MHTMYLERLNFSQPIIMMFFASYLDLFKVTSRVLIFFICLIIVQ